MKFLLVGHGGFYNRGCEAILLTTIEMLNNNFECEEIIISSFDYENDKVKYLGPNVRFIERRAILGRRWALSWWVRQFKKIISSDFRHNCWKLSFAPIVNVLDAVDIVLSIGGDNYTTDYGYPGYSIYLNRLVKEANKKLVIWGASIGPFPEDDEFKMAKVLKLADLITARESCTIEYLNKLGVVDNVKPVADPAFLLPRDSTNVKEDIFFDGKNILGFNISPLLKRYKGENWGDKIIDEIVCFLRQIIDDCDLSVILIPHVIGTHWETDDCKFMDAIYRQLKDTDKINKISAEYNAMQMKYVISRCRFFIGARTHSTIAALSSEVPTLSIGYSMKARGINKDIFGCLDYMIDFNELSSKYLFEKFSNLVNSELNVRKTLSEQIPRMKKAALDNGRYLKEI